LRNDAVQPIRTEVKRAFSALLFTLITDVDGLLILARDPEILRCANIGIQHPSGYEDIRMNKLIMKMLNPQQRQQTVNNQLVHALMTDHAPDVVVV